MAYTQHYYCHKETGSIVHCGGSMSPEWERLSNADGARRYRAQCVAELREMLTPGQTVYCTLRSVSRSGMRRCISLHVVIDGRMRSLDFLASRAMGDRIADHGGIVVSGCGMDMGFHLVYSLGRTVWPNGTPEPHGTRNGVPDSDGGYALKSEWL
jgi:hypothetical protein